MENLELAIEIELRSDSGVEKEYLIEHMLNIALLLLKKLRNIERAKYYALKVLDLDQGNGSASIILGLIHEEL